MAFGERNRVVTLAAAELEDDGLVGGEHLSVPVALDGMVEDVEAGAGAAVEHRIGGRLEETGEGLVLGEFAKLIVTHGRGFRG